MAGQGPRGLSISYDLIQKKMMTVFITHNDHSFLYLPIFTTSAVLVSLVGSAWPRIAGLAKGLLSSGCCQCYECEFILFGICMHFNDMGSKLYRRVFVMICECEFKIEN